MYRTHRKNPVAAVGFHRLASMVQNTWLLVVVVVERRLTTGIRLPEVPEVQPMEHLDQVFTAERAVRNPLEVKGEGPAATTVQTEARTKEVRAEIPKITAAAAAAVDTMAAAVVDRIGMGASAFLAVAVAAHHTH